MLEYKSISRGENMYPIITEKGLRTDGQMEYDAFGVKLVPTNDIITTIENNTDPLVMNPDKEKVLKRILSQGSSDSIFINRKDGTPWIAFDYWLEVVLDPTTKMDLKYNSLAQIYTSDNLYSPLFNRTLELFESYFDTGDDIKSTIDLLYELNKYIRTFQAISFKLVRGTEKKTIVDKPNITPAWLGSPNYLLKANTEILMIFTGTTTYIDEGKEQPIILDGKTRRLIPWKDVTNPKFLNEKSWSTYSSK